MIFSIITPCFNSAKILIHTYESLLNINRKNFEWVLVDDASPDDGETIRVIKNIQKDAPFLVKTVFLEKNYYGANSAYEGALVADGDYVCILDHDDCLLPNALEIVERKIKCSPDNSAIAGVAGRCIDQDGRLIGKNIDIEFIGTEGDLRFKRKFPSELIQFTRRDLIIEYFKMMKPGYTNGFAWASISCKYKWIYINNPLRIYNTSYEHSFTNSQKRKITYPRARAEAIEAAFATFSNYYIYNIPYSLRFIGSAIRYRLHARMGLRKPINNNWKGFFIYIIAIPLGFLRYLTDLRLNPK